MERESSQSPLAAESPAGPAAPPAQPGQEPAAESPSGPAGPAAPPAPPEQKPVPAAPEAAAPCAPRLFVVHAPEDAWFVEGFLLGALRLPDGEIAVSCQPGSGPAVGEVERGAQAPVTVVVVSPAFLSSAWARLAGQIAAYASLEAAGDGRAALIPALLADCELPLQLRFRVALDFRKPAREHWEAEVARLRERLAAPPPAVVLLPCPYPGIRPFTTDDAARFHGRDPEIADLLDRLRSGQRELYVIGPSGCGKSSLVAAGLVPSMRRSPERAGGAFVDRQMRPGGDPAAALAGLVEATPAERGDPTMRWLGDAVGRLLANHPDHRLLIIVDQLEELFTTAQAAARQAFVAAVRVLRGDPRVALVLTLRADFYASLMESALWTDLDGRLSRLDVGPLRGDKLRQAIEAPARALGVYFEPVLVERLLHDVADEPGALPLLQDALVELWQQRTRGLLRLAEYEAMGDGARTGLAVTVARRADAALAELSPDRRAIARRVLLRLVQFGDGAATARRQQTRAALATTGDAPDEIDAVIGHLADHRLITTSAGDGGDRAARVDLAHEILLTAWPALAGWIQSRRQDEQRRRALQARAAEWVNHGRGSSRLLDGDELHEVRGWLTDDKARDLGIGEDIQSLLERSAAALAAQLAEIAERRRRWRRWVTAAIAGLTAAVVAVSTLAVIAQRRSREASEQALVADRQSREARRQAALADQQSREARRQLARYHVAQGQALLLNDQPAQAAPFLVAAREAGLDGVPLRTLFRWAAQGVPLTIVSYRAPLSAMALSPDGTRLMTVHGSSSGVDDAARIWDASSGQLIAQLPHRSRISASAWSPDSRRVATGSLDRTARVWDARTGQAVTPPLAHRDGVARVAWSPDGTRLATAAGDTARVWDASTGQAVTPLLVHRAVADERVEIAALAWSPDGKRVATADSDGFARVWDARTGEAVTPPLAHRGPVAMLAWSPDGTRLATASDDKTAQIWDPRTGRSVTPPLVHPWSVDRVAWSPDGTRVATATYRSARVWSAATGQPVTPLVAHQDVVVAVAWSPDGTQIATASADSTARVWSAASGDPVTPPLKHHDSVVAVAWSPDGTRVATASDDASARVWDARTGQPVTPSLRHGAALIALAWSPDGTRIATGSYDSSARVWDARGRPPMALEHQAAIGAVAWSPDGTRLVTGSDDATARVWDARTGQAVAPPLVHKDKVTAVAWSPDGRRVATASDDATARVWDAATGQAATPPLVHQDKVTAVAWSPDGRRVATGSDDETARVWDATSGQQLGRSLEPGKILALAWSPDGRLATSTYDRAQLWDATRGKQLTPPLEHDDVVYALAWSPDGTRLATGDRDSTVQIWDTATGKAVMPPLAHQAPLAAVAWSPDGSRLATASNDRTARVWDARTGQAVTRALVHDDVVVAVAWSPDGSRVATASQDGTARVWDASSGQALTPPLAHPHELRAVAWSPDGARLATSGDDEAARVWDVSWDRGALADWRAVLQRCDYRLNEDGVLITRDPASAPPAGSTASPAQPAGSAASPAPPAGSAASPAPPAGSTASPAPAAGSAVSPAPPAGHR